MQGLMLRNRCLAPGAEEFSNSHVPPPEDGPVQPNLIRREEYKIHRRCPGAQSRPRALTWRYVLMAAALKLRAGARTTSTPESRSVTAVRRYSSSRRTAAWRV